MTTPTTPTTPTPVAAPSKKKQKLQTANAAAVAHAEAVDLTYSLQSLSGAGVEIQQTLSKISENLIGKHAELLAVDTTIKIKKQELAALHGVDSVLLSIDDAKTLQSETIEELNREREAIKASNNLLEENLNQQRKREDAEFVYQLNQRRKQDADAWAEQVRVRANTERDRQETFEKSFSFREEGIKKQETAYTEAIAKLATFDAELKAKSDREVAIALNSLKKDYTHQMELVDVKHGSEILRMGNEVASNSKTIAAQEKQIADLQTQLKAAQEAQITLAKATVDGASNKAAQADALALMSGLGGVNGKQGRA